MSSECVTTWNLLLASEDINAYEMDLGVAVLAGLRGGHLHNLAGTPLQHDEPVLTQSRALHGEGRGRTGVGGVELGIFHGVSHC